MTVVIVFLLEEASKLKTEYLRLLKKEPTDSKQIKKQTFLAQHMVIHKPATTL